eukprot:COSAG06_NODE_57920_length_278_cov_2.312849_1_plen_37_part_10
MSRVRARHLLPLPPLQVGDARTSSRTVRAGRRARKGH